MLGPYGLIGRLMKRDDPLPYILLVGFALFLTFFLVTSDSDRFAPQDVMAKRYLQKAAAALDADQMGQAREYLGRFNGVAAKVSSGGSAKTKEKFTVLLSEADALRARLR
jgi:hypothetical protein